MYSYDDVGSVLDPEHTTVRLPHIIMYQWHQYLPSLALHCFSLGKGTEGAAKAGDDSFTGHLP
jgi:hypothetical protein